MSRFFLLFFLLSLSHISWSQVIAVDASFDDWADIPPSFVDELNDGQNNGIDFENVWAYNDEKYLYFRFELNKEINLQENNELAIYIDYDNNINTGFKINGIGAELRYFFGERFGIISEGSNNEFVNFVPVEMTVSPSVSSTQFELAFLRDINDSGISFEAQSTIQFRIEDNSFNGDEAPNDLSGIQYEIDENIVSEYPQINLDKDENTDFRLLTYNIENDQLFEANRKDNFRRIFQAIQPDIIALQEVRDFSSTQTKNIIEEFLPGQWYHKKHGFDIVLVSRYPILFSEPVDGNAAFYLDVDGQEVLVINCHLPCCDNNIDRQSEVDEIMEYVRNLKNGLGNFQVDSDIPIIITGDMNFVGDSEQPNTFITGDIFNNSTYGPDFQPDWDNSPFEDVNGQTTNTNGNFTWFNPFGSFFPGKLDWIVYSDSQLDIQKSFNLWTTALPNSILNQYGLQRGDEINAADHLPVVADFYSQAVNTTDFVEIELHLYPNPAIDKIYVEPNHIIIESAKIINQEGQVMKSILPARESNVIFDVSNLRSGMYYILMTTPEGRVAKSFIKR